jgi:hypothetical protein
MIQICTLFPHTKVIVLNDDATAGANRKPLVRREKGGNPMKNKSYTVLFLVTGLILLAGVLAPMATAREGVWRADRFSPAAAPQLGSEVQLSHPSTPSGENWYRPTIAYNSQRHEYLVVTHNDWSTGRAIYGSIVTDAGAWQSWFQIFESSGKDSVQPAVAYNHMNNQYLVVWMYNANSDGNTYEIWGEILSGDCNTVVKPAFQIITWPNRSFWTPRVAWNSYRNEYLVVWSAMDTSGGFPGVPSGISSMLLSSTGNIITGRNLTTSDSPQQADVTYNLAKNEYLVVFAGVQHHAPGHLQRHLWAAREPGKRGDWWGYFHLHGTQTLEHPPGDHQRAGPLPGGLGSRV